MTEAIPTTRGKIELPKVSDGEIAGRPTKVVDGKELWECLRIQTPFNDWMTRRAGEFGLKAGVDYHANLRGMVKTPANTGDKPKKGRTAKRWILRADVARHIAASERNRIGKAIRDYLFRIEDEFWRTNADGARRIHDDLTGRLAALQQASDAQGALLELRTRDAEARIAALEGEVVTLQTAALRRDVDDDMRRTEERLKKLRTRRHEIDGIAGTGCATHRKGARQKAAGSRMQCNAAHERHKAEATAMLDDLGIATSRGGQLRHPLAFTGANDSFVRMVRRWSVKAARHVAAALLRNAARTGSPAALSTLTVRAFADLPVTWAGYAGTAWFSDAVAHMDIASIHEAVTSTPEARAGERYVRMRDAIMRELEPARKANVH